MSFTPHPRVCFSHPHTHPPHTLSLLLTLTLTSRRTARAQNEVDEEHERYFENIKKIDPDFETSMTHFIVLDTERYGSSGGGSSVFVCE